MKYLFDLAANPIFVSGGCEQLPDHLSDFHFSKLPMLLRIFLSTDGTVSKAIEAAFNESLNVSLISESTLTVAPNVESLLHREINLIGKKSGQIYTYASSYLNLSYVPDNLLDELKNSGHGVGWLLRKMNKEQYREIFDLGYSEDLPEQFRPKGFSKGVYRIYCIRVGGERFMEITEHYPLDFYTNSRVV